MPKLKLDLPKAAMIRQLAAEGQSYSTLAKAFKCSPSLVGQIVRGSIWVHSPCEGCRAPIPGYHTSGLCEACKKQHCCRCHGPKSPYRKSDQCAPCDRAKWNQHLASREPRCRQCGESLPETRRDTLCSDCRQDEQAFFQQYRRKRAVEQGILCKIDGCDTLVPAGQWHRNLCREHAAEHDRRRRSLSRRLCGICEKLLSDTEVGLCRPCRAIDRRIKRIGTGSERKQSP